MIYMSKDGSYFPPINLELSHDELVYETKNVVFVLCDFIAGVKNSKGIEREFSLDPQMTTTEKLFIYYFNKMYESNLSMDSITRKKTFMNYRFYLYDTDNKEEMPSFCPYKNTYPSSTEAGPTYSFFIPDEMDETRLILSIYNWIDCILTLMINRKVATKVSDSHFRFNITGSDIIINNSFDNPNFIRFFVDYYKIVFEIFAEVCNVSMNFGANNPDVEWNNLAEFIRYLEQFQQFGFEDCKMGKCLDFVVDHITAALYEVAEYVIASKVNDNMGLYCNCIDILTETNISDLKFMQECKEAKEE